MTLKPLSRNQIDIENILSTINVFETKTSTFSLNGNPQCISLEQINELLVLAKTLKIAYTFESQLSLLKENYPVQIKLN